MEKKFLKTLRDKAPEPVKNLFGPIFRNLLVRNKVFIKTYESLIERESLPETQVKDIQFAKLKDILIHAGRHVPYYRKLFEKVGFDPSRFSNVREMEAIPFLTREIVREQFDELIADIKTPGGFYTGSTGGSSGYPLSFLLDYNSIYSENAFIYYYRRRLGYQFGDKLATFRGIEFEDKLWQLSPMYNELIFSPVKLSRLTVKQYVHRINKYQPQYLNGYSSSLWFFATLMKECNLKLNVKLKGIFLMSEGADPDQRKFLEEFFGVASSIHYGHSERAVLARERKPWCYEFDPYYGYTELLPAGDNGSAIVCTGLLNYTMPLIRYKTDDTCYEMDGLYVIEGKRSSTMGLYGYHGEYLPAAAFDLENDVYRNITHYQFVQNEIGKAELLILVRNDFSTDELPAIQKQLDHNVKGIMNISIRIVDKLILSPRGKFQQYLVNIKDDKGLIAGKQL